MSRYLLSAAVAALMISIAPAGAQTATDAGTAGAVPCQPGTCPGDVPAGGSAAGDAGSMDAGATVAPDAAAGSAAAPNDAAGGAAQSAEGALPLPKPGDDAAAAGTDQPATNDQATGTQVEDAGNDAAAAGADQPATNDQATGTKVEDNEDAAAAGTDQPATNDQAAGEKTGEPEGETGAVDLTVEQRTEFRTVIQEVNVEPVRDIDIEINVGVKVPTTIELHRLPPRVVEIVPAYRSYVFFVLADGRIVIVNPDTLVIVTTIVV